jgi:hypothetical protein
MYIGEKNMGKGGSNTNSTTSTKPTYAATSQTNPYFQTKTDKNGNLTTTFKNGTATQQAYDYVNANANRLLKDYMTPSLDSVENKAMMNAYTKALNENTNQTLNNSILNPLLSNNMIRSSQATNMYNNLSNQIADNISDYTNELIANSRANSWDMINNLMSLYTNGYQGIANETSNALQASVGNTSSSKSGSK